MRPRHWGWLTLCVGAALWAGSAAAQTFFTDVTDSLFAARPFRARGVAWGDIDNDGDLDLMVGNPVLLFLNSGDGTFAEATAQSGIHRNGMMVCFGDDNRDGFLDVAFGDEWTDSGSTRLVRNNGNGNHWLQVELVGVQSNRQGIGVRVVATSGDLRQTREVLGGRGYEQDEPVAHFGLAARTRVDELEVRWPSGQVDVLRDVPADQRIRVVEGESSYWAVHPMTAPWTDTLLVDTPADFLLRVQPALFHPNARVTRVVADLTALGGEAEVALTAQGDGSYLLRTTLPAPAANGFCEAAVLVEQETPFGHHWSRLARSVVVVPASDLVIYDEVLAGGWRVGPYTAGAAVDLQAAEQVRTGTHAMALRGGSAGWVADLQASAPLCAVGYRLRFSLHPGTAVLRASGPTLEVRIGSRSPVDLLAGGHVDFSRPQWQDVELSTAQFGDLDALQSITFTGNCTGTFYLDDIRLVPERPSWAPTAVQDMRSDPLPAGPELLAAYPNPFNASTVIRYSLPTPGPVALAVYDVAGQKVVTLARGERPAGTHAVTWDGRGAHGRPLASGVYLCRLRADGRPVATRTLVLVR
ncbi:MAG: ASPIC/UnbV domain-containing protein [Candidatus Latescibacterota bacterium]